MSTPGAVVPIDSRVLRTRSLTSVPLYAWLAVAAFCAVWTMLGALVVPSARAHDFLNLYTGASLAREGNFAGMHLPETQLAREREYVPKLPELVPFVRLPIYGALLSPMAALPFGTAFWVWLGLQTVLLLAIWLWCFRQWGPDALILASLFLPTALGIAHGQDCVLMLGVVTATYILARRQDEFLAGAVLGLGFIKFHLFILWPLALVFKRRWRMSGGAVCTIVAGLSVSYWLAGGLGNYFALLQMKDLNHLSPSPELMINVHSLAINAGLPQAWFRGVLVALAVALTGLACWRAPLWRWMAAACAGSLLVVPHVYGYDAGLLLVPLLLAIYESGTAPWVRAAAAILVTPLPFFAALAGSPWAAAAPAALLVFLAALASQFHRFPPMASSRTQSLERTAP